MQEDKDAKIIMDLIASASKAATSTSTPKVQNTFVIHGGRQVFVQATSKRTSPKAKPPAKGRR